MNTIHWGRRETIVTPPQAPVYSYAAIALTLILTVVFLRIYTAEFMTPLERFDLWPYLQSGAVAGFRQTDQYQLLSVADSHLHARPAVATDVEPGVTTLEFSRPLPLQLSMSARTAGLVYLYRGRKMSYRNGPLHAYLQQFVYRGHTVAGVFRWPLLAGLGVLLIMLPVRGPQGRGAVQGDEVRAAAEGADAGHAEGVQPCRERRRRGLQNPRIEASHAHSAAS